MVLKLELESHRLKGALVQTYRLTNKHLIKIAMVSVVKSENLLIIHTFVVFIVFKESFS